MMESVRTWVLSILAAALLLGLLESCAPQGPVRSVAKLAAGLALFLAVAAPLEERLTCYRQHTVPQEEIEAFARARIDGRIIGIWKYRALAPHEAEFEIAAHLLPDRLISWMLRRVK